MTAICAISKDQKQENSKVQKQEKNFEFDSQSGAWEKKRKQF